MRSFMKRVLITIFLLMMMLLHTGCWDQRLYEEIGFILQFGFETEPNGQMIMSVTSPVIEEEAEEKVEFLYESTENLIRASREKIRDSSGKMLLGGKTQQIFFSKDLARKGLQEFMEIFLRNPENPLLSNIVIVDGSPKEMLQIGLEYKDKPRLAIYISNLLRDAQRKLTTAETRIHDFTTEYYSGTIDPATPIIRYNKDKVEVTGSAVFCEDKMVGEIDIYQALLLNVLLDKKKVFEYIYKGPVPNENKDIIKKGAAMTVSSYSSSCKIDIAGSVPLIKIKLKVRTMLDEYASEHRMGDDNYKKELEKLIETAIQDEILHLLKYLQKVGSDPVGFGEKVRASHNKYWKSVNWREVYPNAEFEVTVNVNIEFYGAIE